MSVVSWWHVGDLGRSSCSIINEATARQRAREPDNDAKAVSDLEGCVGMIESIAPRLVLSDLI